MANAGLAVNDLTAAGLTALMLSREGARYTDFGCGCKPGAAVYGCRPSKRGGPMFILPISLTMAGAAAILHIWLSLRVSRLRRPLKIGVGDGGNEVLARRMRAHGNFAENMPILLILLTLLELGTGGSLWLWGAAIAFMLARIAHAFGMDRPGANPLRVGGITVSWLVLIGLGLYAIIIAYQSPPLRSGFQIGPARAEAPAAPRS